MSFVLTQTQTFEFMDTDKTVLIVIMERFCKCYCISLESILHDILNSYKHCTLFVHAHQHS